MIDCRSKRPYKEALRELLRVLKESVPPLGTLFDVPKLPAHFLARPESINALRYAVLTEKLKPSGLPNPTLITSAKQDFALQGMGGVGKSVLAAAFARDCETRRAFEDGIVWLALGRNPRLPSLLEKLGRALGDDSPDYANPGLAGVSLARALAPKVCLIVLDDIWEVTDAHVFVNTLGPRCRLLVTTRNLNIAQALGAQVYPLDVLPDEQAWELLARWSGQPASALPLEARQAAAECGNLPLALAMIGAMVGNNPSRWENALYKLRSADLQKI